MIVLINCLLFFFLLYIVIFVNFLHFYANKLKYFLQLVFKFSVLLSSFLKMFMLYSGGRGSDGQL